MVSTNEISIGSTVAPALMGVIQEVVASIVAVIIPVLVALWRRSASKSKIQTAVIDALVRAIEKSSHSISEGDTTFIKKNVKEEAEKAGVQPEVHKAVQEVASKMAEEKKPVVNS